MSTIDYHLVDVFTKTKYGGNQLAVFLDFDDLANADTMQNIAKELNFSEVSFIKKQLNRNTFDVRIFTPEYEVPFAGHPTLGTAFVISKHITKQPTPKLNIQLKHATINVDLENTGSIDETLFTMTQAQPKFIETYEINTIAEGLNIDKNVIDASKPIVEISTGLPYIIIPVINLEAMNQLNIKDYDLENFLKTHQKHKTNSPSKLSTSLFFVTSETFDKTHNFNARMFCLEGGKLVEDAATGSANGCFLAYLLKYESPNISAIVEQGFQMNRKSLLYLNGTKADSEYQIKVGGHVVDIGSGKWSI
ncbi:PhzF family phenazine biosynthesis protein [Winogradskyella ouciana]|uniref:PhzF family phenazine biosynthesis isomerase n=1 Tax=Winogradskyella ouciana TaxID=2608631 RepID=A0A7K1GEP4_9FLAO|nr:PhzF family phenazine biosynthesis protein [Winogradskyella ouciana]MTE27756.1 PhzF family phenazine biosynthesis isomerase [Winogradskyella ouciana]